MQHSILNSIYIDGSLILVKIIFPFHEDIETDGDVMSMGMFAAGIRYMSRSLPVQCGRWTIRT